ncbi:MAG: Spy/CpxP family protein refolding chaperone [Acidobacteriota bacterium]|nr:Spy/CpxP family protein refolding chaperone [Acidobacteriota bacterium]MDH3528208.1 Spy/CpxP family protein refolding chaperone [Acidobacteriota bacterium]
MSIRRHFLSFLGLVFVFTAFSAVTYAQETSDTKTDNAEKSRIEGRKGQFGRKGRSGFRGGRGHHGMVRGLHKLDLTEPQKAQIKTIMETHILGQQPFREEMRSLVMKMRDGTGTEDDKARIAELRAQKREASEQVKNSILAVLTPEQLQKMEQMKAERKQRMEERRQRWMERKQQQKPVEPTKTDN